MVTTTAAHTSWSANSASATRSRFAPIDASSTTSATAATASAQMKPRAMEAEQVLDRQVGAGEQRHGEAEQRQRARGLREVVAEHDPQERLAGHRVHEHHRHRERGDQRDRAREHPARVHAARGAP
jgi:hypothetical protein